MDRPELEEFEAAAAFDALLRSVLPELFLLRALQAVREAILGRTLTKPAFRRKMLDRGYLNATSEREAAGAFRAAELYRRAAPNDATDAIKST